MKTKTILLDNAEAVDGVSVGHKWRSGNIRASLWRLIWFAFASGDWSSTHVNPFTSWLFKSNLGGLAFSIDFVLAMTKVGMYQIFSFGEDAEVIARGYDSVVFWRPLRLGARFYYTFTLLGHVSAYGRKWHRWRFNVVESRSDKMICSGVWTAGFFPVKRSRSGSILSLVPVPLLRVSVLSIFLIAVLLSANIAYRHFTSPTWSEFLATLDRNARNFYLDCDLDLIEQIKHGRSVLELAKVGTSESPRMAWGEGP